MVVTLLSDPRRVLISLIWTPLSCAAAKQLKERERELQHAVLLIFQPAEEGKAGGKLVADSGVLEGVQALHGLHVWPDLPSGVIASKVAPASTLRSKMTKANCGRHLTCVGETLRALPDRSVKTDQIIRMDTL